MDNQLINIVLKDTYTLSRLKTRVRVLKSYLLKAIFTANEDHQAISEQADLAWLSSMTKEFYQSFNKDNVYKIFTEAENYINQLKPLIIYLPFPADDDIALQIGSFARINFNNPHLLLDIKYDPALIAGAAIVSAGVYKDYSTRAKIEEKRAQILQGFKKFLR